ncbi:Ras-related protein Rab-3B [Liparis tanakae]|uniref:Ras-related protein Rab-3B n=1 Tax=Liparis tanakae TaxID=230148 RepID=A0A4Z2EFR4_9TELE|nr:Ras-related protein Rab-3B [Liparis tanakae]
METDVRHEEVTRREWLRAGFEYFEASAKENINVRQVFERLVDIICVKMSERVDVEVPAAPGAKTTRLTDKPAQLPQKCC